MSMELLRKLEDNVTQPNVTQIEQATMYEQSRYLATFMFFSVLVFSQILMYYMRKAHCSLIPESGVMVVLGLIIGGIVNIFDTPGHDMAVAIENLTSFDETLFFVVLLPPVIFDSAYSMRKDAFFGNFGAIMLLAVIGTIIMSFFTAALMYLLGSIGIVYSASFFECLVFGSLISATDPVAVIATFHRLGVNQLLYILVFGESLLNDAVAIALVQGVLTYEDDAITPGRTFSFWWALLEFVRIFLGSVGIGIFVGLCGTLVFKYLKLWDPEMRKLESALIVSLPYIAYTLAGGTNTSAIIALLFCGIFLSSYTRFNLSCESELFLREFYGVIAHLAETFIFIYLGVSSVTGGGIWNLQSAMFGILGFIICAIARLIIVPLIGLANLCRSDSERISWKVTALIWHSGMRGGMAFALATSSANQLNDPTTGKVFETATTIIVFLGIFINGSTIELILRKLDLLVISNRDTEESSVEYSAQNRHPDSTTEVELTGTSFNENDPGGKWESFDRRFMRRVLIRSEDETSRVEDESMESQI